MTYPMKLITIYLYFAPAVIVKWWQVPCYACRLLGSFSSEKRICIFSNDLYLGFGLQLIEEGRLPPLSMAERVSGGQVPSHAIPSQQPFGPSQV